MFMSIEDCRRRVGYSMHAKGVEELTRMAEETREKLRESKRLLARGVDRHRVPSYLTETRWGATKLSIIETRIAVLRGKEKSMERFPIERFIEAQENIYAQALRELQAGKKRTHWMWYIFPQLRFLGQSDRSYYYGIADEQEAKEYCANELLHGRYIECCTALLSVAETNPNKIMGYTDALKLHSSLTLFYMVDEGNKPLYERLIEKFYDGKWDEATREYLLHRRA